jgi:hypothetical protein
MEVRCTSTPTRQTIRVVGLHAIGVAAMTSTSGYYPEPWRHPLVSCLGFHGHLLENLMVVGSA